MKALCAVLFFVYSIAQASILSPNRERDLEAIERMQGCYEVTFQFAETFPVQAGYEIHKPYRSKALEWVSVDEKSADKISLQHILIVGGGSYVIKHWRQVWENDPSFYFTFLGKNRWKKEFVSESDDNLWVQRVYQVDDSPRYECVAPWIHHSDKSYWECQSDNPLPRREFSKRSDYHILNRINRHEIVDSGWLHLQDNQKVKLVGEEEERQVLTRESGRNIYKRVEDRRCLTGKEWWEKNREIWKYAVKVWNKIYNERNQLTFDFQVTGKKMYFLMDKLATKHGKLPVFNPNQFMVEVEALILNHLK